MPDIKCINCGAKVGSASKKAKDETDLKKSVTDFAVLCGDCSKLPRNKLKQKAKDKLNL